MKNGKGGMAVVAALLLVLGSGPVFAQSGSPKIYFDVFLGMGKYSETTPDDVRKTWSAVINGVEYLNASWTGKNGLFSSEELEDADSFVFLAGGSFSYLFSQRIGAYIDVAYLNALNISMGLDFIAGLDSNGLPVGNVISTRDGKLESNGRAAANSKVNADGITFSVGPTFRLVEKVGYTFFLTPKFNFQSYTLSADIDDGFYLNYGGGGQTLYPASHNFTQVATEYGAGLIADWRCNLGRHMQLILKCALNLDFYQKKSMTQTTEFGSNKLSFETVADSAVTNFSFYPMIGIGFAF